MKKTSSNSSSQKRLKKLCKDIALDLSRLELDKAPPKEVQPDRAKIERKRLFKEVKKKIDGLS